MFSICFQNFLKTYSYTVWQESFKTDARKNRQQDRMAKQIYFIQYTPLPHRHTHHWVAGRDQPTDLGLGRSRILESPSGHALQLSESPTHHQTDNLSGESQGPGIKNNQHGPNLANTVGGAAKWCSFWIKTAKWGGRYARAHYCATGTKPWTRANLAACAQSVSAVGQAHVCRSLRSPFAPEEWTQHGSCHANRKTQINIVFMRDFCQHSFCDLGDPWPVHSALCRLLVGSYAKHHDSSPVTIVVKNAGSWRCAARRSYFFYPGLRWWCDVSFLD